MRPAAKISTVHSLKGFACALLLLLLVCASLTVASAQEARSRLAQSLTSEDLLGRRVVGVPAPGANGIAPSSATKARAAASTFYLDPAGRFALSLPGGNWRAKAQSDGHLYSRRVFRRIEDEGFASATANVYVFNHSVDLPVNNISRLSPVEQEDLARNLAARFLSSNVALISVDAAARDAGTGVHIIADQIIARRAVVRAAIDAFEQQGRLFVVVCCAPVESFQRRAPEFEAITKSLASTATRS